MTHTDTQPTTHLIFINHIKKYLRLSRVLVAIELSDIILRGRLWPILHGKLMRKIRCIFGKIIENSIAHWLENRIKCSISVCMCTCVSEWVCDSVAMTSSKWNAKRFIRNMEISNMINWKQIRHRNKRTKKKKRVAQPFSELFMALREARFWFEFDIFFLFSRQRDACTLFPRRRMLQKKKFNTYFL